MPPPSAGTPAFPSPSASLPTPGTCALSDLPTGQPARVEHLDASADLAEWADWLAEIGFLPGEGVTVLRRSPIGGDPLVVRIGDSTFALHRAEAACVTVRPLPIDANRTPGKS